MWLKKLRHSVLRFSETQAEVTSKTKIKGCTETGSSSSVPFCKLEYFVVKFRLLHTILFF